MGKEKGKSQTKESRAGIVLKVSRTRKAMKRVTGRKRLGSKAQIVATAMVEALLTEFLRDTNDRLRQDKKDGDTSGYVNARHFNSVLHDTNAMSHGIFPKQIAGLMMSSE